MVALALVQKSAPGIVLISNVTFGYIWVYLANHRSIISTRGLCQSQ
jgi:hypothetical protein